MRVALFLCLAALSGISFAAELAVSAFSQLPRYQQPSLSPDGRRVAFIRNMPDAGFAVLSMYDTQERKMLGLLKTDNEELKIRWFRWANNRTLLMGVSAATYRNRVDTTETRLYAVDVDVENPEPRSILNPRRVARRNGYVSQFQDSVIDYLPDDPEHVLIELDKDHANLPSVFKLNIYDRSMERIEMGKHDIRSWITDQQGRLRVGSALNYEDGDAAIRYRLSTDEDDADWRILQEYNALEESGIQPLGFGLDADVLFYRAYKGDKKALFKVHLPTLQHSLVFQDPDYDVDGGLIYSPRTRDVIGIYHANTATGRIYWDEDIDRLQRSLDQALPDFDNYITTFSRDENRYILYAESDVQPGIYLIGDRQKHSLDMLFEQYPQIPKEQLAPHELTTYTTRDGVEIEGYLTLPPGKEGPAPTIMHPHGGPGARDVDGFDYWTSYFTSRGYAVFRPNFRGSTGYGREFAEAQMQAWGLQMQDDITDAAHWLVKQGIADPERMCIVGASYGGYAATMAATKTPDLFRCAVSYAGVMDLNRLVRESRHYVNEEFVRNQIGDKSRDLKKRSPYFQAENIQIPILLIHGEDDRVVDVEQSRRFHKRLERLDKAVEYLELENGDHHLSIQRNRHAAFAAMDTFLRTHLSPAQPVLAKQPAG